MPQRPEALPPAPSRTALSQPVHVRTLFLSDLHFGANASRPDLVLAFLHGHSADTYYLVGDIFELISPFTRKLSAAELEVLSHLRARRDSGAKVIYLVGNHDPAPRLSIADHLLPADPQVEIIHHTANGRRFLVLHGDVADRRLFRSHILTRSCIFADQSLRCLDAAAGAIFTRSGPAQRTAVECVLSWVNWLIYPTRSHERRLIEVARNGGLDGVICGHFHIAALNDLHGLTYANSGDWVDSFTALAENHDGSLGILGGRKALTRPAAADVALEGALA